MTFPQVSNFNDSEELITYIFPDFNAVKKFESDFVASNEFYLIEETVAYGYEIYLIEQWVLHRKLGILVTTFNGKPSSRLSAIKFTVIKKETKQYPNKFQDYLNELVLHQAKLIKLDVNSHSKEFIYVTNISLLPSNLFLIPIHEGDYRQVEQNFVVNSNLKRLHCSGRTSMLLTSKISDSVEDKFRQIYHFENINIPMKFATRELINVIQMSLFYFDLLDVKYCDGILCSKTEEAIMDWWNIIGLPHFSFKPNLKQGVLTSVSVAAIISLVLSTRLRMQIIGGADVPKDAFDFENFMISIGQIQKQFKLEKKRKLDIQTLGKIFAVTSPKYKTNDSADDFSTEFNYLHPNAYSGSYVSGFPYSKEFKKLTNVVKSTVQERIIAPSKDMDSYSTPKSGGRIRNRIAKLAENLNPADIETLDLEYLVNGYLTGKTLNRLWNGDSSAISGTNGGNFYEKGRSLSSRSKNKVGHRHHHYPHLRAPSDEDNVFRFESLKERVARTQEIFLTSVDPTDSRNGKGGITKKLGLAAMKFGSSYDPKKFGVKNDLEIQGKNNTSDRNADLNIMDHDNVGPHDPDICSPTKSDCELYQNLNRRHSFPFMSGNLELNLNLIDLSKNEQILSPDNSLKRTSSLPLLEYDSHLNKRSNFENSTIEFSKLYLKTFKEMISLSSVYRKLQLGSSDSKYTTAEIERLFQKLNHESLTFSHVYNQLLLKKDNLLHGDMIEKVDCSMDDLEETVERLMYETRIVAKRLHELEEDYSLFESKLDDLYNKKLNSTINSILSSPKFFMAFPIDDERNQVITKLTGQNYSTIGSSKTADKSLETTIWCSFFYFFYDFLVHVLQFFHIDENKLDLGRIKNVWGKLYPNRNAINIYPHNATSGAEK